MKNKEKEIIWRRAKILDMMSSGVTNQSKIARELQVSDATVSIDIQHLRDQAKMRVKQYVTDILPLQYETCINALDTVIRQAHDMMVSTVDGADRDRLSALSLFKETHLEKLSLISDSNMIDHAIKFIQEKQTQLKQEPKESADIAIADEQTVF